MDIDLLFLIQKKGPLFIKGQEGQKKRLHWKAFQNNSITPSNRTCFAFFRRKKYIGPDCITHRRRVVLLYLSKNILIVIKLKCPVQIKVFGMFASDGDVMSLFILVHVPSTQRSLKLNPRRSWSCSGPRGLQLEDTTSGNKIVSCQTSCLDAYIPSNSLDYNRLENYIRGAVEQKTK